jgi:hypothetical protein
MVVAIKTHYDGRASHVCAFTKRKEGKRDTTQPILSFFLCELETRSIFL